MPKNESEFLNWNYESLPTRLWLKRKKKAIILTFSQVEGQVSVFSRIILKFQVRKSFKFCFKSASIAGPRQPRGGNWLKGGFSWLSQLSSSSLLILLSCFREMYTLQFTLTKLLISVFLLDILDRKKGKLNVAKDAESDVELATFPPVLVSCFTHFECSSFSIYKISITVLASVACVGRTGCSAP